MLGEFDFLAPAPQFRVELRYRCESALSGLAHGKVSKSEPRRDHRELVPRSALVCRGRLPLRKGKNTFAAGGSWVFPHLAWWVEPVVGEPNVAAAPGPRRCLG